MFQLLSILNLEKWLQPFRSSHSHLLHQQWSAVGTFHDATQVLLQRSGVNLQNVDGFATTCYVVMLIIIFSSFILDYFHYYHVYHHYELFYVIIFCTYLSSIGLTQETKMMLFQLPAQMSDRSWLWMVATCYFSNHPYKRIVMSFRLPALFSGNTKGHILIRVIDDGSLS